MLKTAKIWGIAAKNSNFELQLGTFIENVISKKISRICNNVRGSKKCRYGIKI